MNMNHELVPVLGNTIISIEMLDMMDVLDVDTYDGIGARGALELKFNNNKTLRIIDDGQSCCEERYMTTDDVLSDYVGATLLGMELKEPVECDTNYNDAMAHDTVFLEILTSKGSLTIVNHNRHNGYYAGFDIETRILG